MASQTSSGGPYPSPPSSASFHGPSPSFPSSSSIDDEVPPLTTKVLTEKDDQTEALHLIADSIAQQRQSSNYALITNPLVVTLWLGVLAFLYQTLYIKNDNLGKFATSMSGVTMILLAFVRMLGGGYLKAAEAFNWEFLTRGKGEGEEGDLLIGTRFGEEMIGALVLRVEDRSNKVKKVSSSQEGNSKALVRAWTVKLRYRRKGIGSSLLEEAVRVSREKGGKDVDITFADDHANSLMILPSFFNRHFKVGQGKAVKMLQEVVEGGEVRFRGR